MLLWQDAGRAGCDDGGGGEPGQSPLDPRTEAAAEASQQPSPVVFVSYSHDSKPHEARVLALADRLVDEGVDARLDQYVAHPREGWPGWCAKQVHDADFVIAVCTADYRRYVEEEPTDKGIGVRFESLLVQQLIYDAESRNEKAIAVTLDDGSEDDVPLLLRPFARYRLDERANRRRA